MPLISQDSANDVSTVASTVDTFLINRYYNNVLSIQWGNVQTYVSIDYLGVTQEYTYPVYLNNFTFPKVTCFFDYTDEITEVQNLHADLLQIISTFQGPIINIGADDISFAKATFSHIDTLFDQILDHFLNNSKLYAQTDVSGARSQCVIQTSPTDLATPLDFRGNLYPVYAKSPLTRNEVQDVQKNAQSVAATLSTSETDNVISALPNVTGSGNVGQTGGGSLGLTAIPTVETGTTGLLTLINKLYISCNNNMYIAIKRASDAASKANKILIETNKILGNLNTIYASLKAYHQSENDSLAETNSIVSDIRVEQVSFDQSTTDTLSTLSTNIDTLNTNLQTISDYINQSNQTVYNNLQTIADQMVTTNGLQSGLQQVIQDSDQKYQDLVQRLTAIENKLP